MFKNHCRKINKFATTSPENFHRVVVFVLLTIQQDLKTVNNMIDDVKKKSEKSKFLWGFKRQGFNDSLNNSDYLLQKTKELKNRPDLLLLEYINNIICIFAYLRKSASNIISLSL